MNKLARNTKKAMWRVLCVDDDRVRCLRLPAGRTFAGSVRVCRSVCGSMAGDLFILPHLRQRNSDNNVSQRDVAAAEAVAQATAACFVLRPSSSPLIRSRQRSACNLLQ